MILIYGHPCSGKTTLANEIATKDSIIFDLDKITETMCPKLDPYEKNELLTEYLILFRNALLSENLENLIVIVTRIETVYDFIQEDTEVIHVDTDLKTCYERCKKERPLGYLEYFKQ